ncbi:nucleotide-diphospho-sugar transferase [Choiromyces venosus 120613-1]|uniref:Mannose-1-phosphate guanyltransferase n=1 Tax=Choiromyces venosus 120613-1 TaxID=1336337 RepID=A0A3N4K567_9PEZI|nr:nucleotide-diphospho-sugar transferase [Choiromyces venosus 120613-1]
MSNRKDKKSSGGKKQAEEQQRENILQAVVLADSFQKRFRPFTLETPRCLLQLANTPLIEYTLEFLALSGVQDVFIFASSHAEKVEEYIRSSRWAQKSSPFKNCRIILSPASVSVGDAMRELDSKQLITTDFLLVHGDFISNLPLGDILDTHRKCRTADKNAIMTMILKEGSCGIRSKAKSERGVFLIDPATNRCVYYDDIIPYGRSGTVIPRELFKDHSELQIRNDLIDCYLDICSPDVPALFTENFDYQHIRRHFLHGILTDYDLYGKTIHTQIIKDYYLARVRSLKAYDGVSKDMMEQLAYPVVPDTNFMDGQSYDSGRGSRYIDESVFLEQSATIKPSTLIGTDTSVGEESVVGSSTIGRNCEIGSGVVIDGSYIWDDVVIGDGCRIYSSVIANGVKLGKDCIVEKGALISYHVNIPDGTTIKAGSKITAYKRKSDTDSDSDDKEDKEDKDGLLAGHEYEDSESEEEDEVIRSKMDSLGFHEEDLINDSESSISTISDDDEDSDDELSPGDKKLRERSDSVTTATSEDNAEADAWHKEAAISLFTAMEGDHPVEVASLELNGLRMTANASWHQVRKATVSALHSRIEQVVATKSKSLSQAANEVFTRWEPLVKRMIFDQADQSDFLLLVQKDCVERKNGSSLLLTVAQRVFELDIVEEEAINAWWADEKSSTEAGGMSKVRQATEVFVKWLAEAEEESSEEEEEDDDEDDE